MSHSSEDGIKKPASDRKPGSNPADNVSARDPDLAGATHRDDQTLSRVTRTLERGIAPSGWEELAPADRELLKTLGGLDQPFVLDISNEFRRTVEVAGAYARHRDRDTDREQTPRDAIDPFDLVDLRVERDSGEVYVGVGEHGPRVGLQAPWAQFLDELREETRVEGDLQLRASYVFLVASLLRLYAAKAPHAGALADTLHAAAAQLPGGLRASMVESVLNHWPAGGGDFIEMVEQLERWDARRDPDSAGRRRAAIALERLLVGDLDEASDASERLRSWLYGPEILAGLGYRAIRAHRQGEPLKAAQLWGQIAPYLRDEPRQVLADAAVYFMRNVPGFFGRIRSPNAGARSTAQLLMMQRRATMIGDARGEAAALYELVLAEVAMGKRAHSAPSPAQAPTGQSTWQARLKSLAAARLFRLSTLLFQLKESARFTQARPPALGELDGVSAYRMLHDAVSLAPRNQVYLRRLVRRARQRGDLNTCAKSLRTLARDYQNRQLAALAATELARTIFLSAPRLEGDKRALVERHLREALRHDPDCAPARLALRRLHLSEEAPAGDGDARGRIDPDAQEAALIARDDWSGLARCLEQKLGQATDPQAWGALAFRLAQLHAWHLSPIADSRLRAEFLEQVLIANPEDLSALVELLDVRLARHEYRAALEILTTLSELAHDLEERGAWLVERAQLLESQLGDPTQAARVFRDALRCIASSTDAFLGLLRRDSFLSDAEVEQGVIAEIVARMDAGISVHESEALAVELIVRAEAFQSARDALVARFSGHPLWQFIRLCTGISAHAPPEGAAQSREALGALQRMWILPEAAELLEVFERIFAHAGAPRAKQQPGKAALMAQLGAIDIAPAQEGRLLRAMVDARALNDPEVFGVLAALKARRSQDFIGRESHLVSMAISFMWGGQDASALKICEHILTRFPDFMPALKLAKILGPRLGRWADVARWCQLEARRTRVERVGFESRLMASEVQQNYLGDFDAACQQFRTLLQQDPGHPEAFEKLKELLLQRGDFAGVFEIFEQRLALHIPVSQRISLLNEMGEIALYRANNTQLSASYFGRSLQLDRQQLRVLRIIGELHHEVGDFAEAIRAYRDAALLSEHTILTVRLLLGIAELHEAAGQPASALDAYQEALATDPDRVHILLDIARLQMDCAAEQEALVSLERLIEHQQQEDNPAHTEALREAMSRRARCLVRLERPHEQVMAAYRDLLHAFPQALDDVDALSAYLGERGAQDELMSFFDTLAARAFLEMKGRPFGAHLAIARRLGHAERAFNLAAVAEALGYSSDATRSYYQAESLPRRWPLAPLAAGIVEELVPQVMAPAFLGVLRHSQAALAKAIPGGKGLAPPGRTTRLDPRDPTLPDGIKRALGWPALFGLTLREAHEYSSDELDADAPHPSLAGGSLVLDDGGLCLYLERRWRDTEDPTALLVHLGQQLAGWCLGIGRWQFLDLRTRFLAVSRVVDFHVPGWGSAAKPDGQALDLDALQSWLEDTSSPELTLYARDLAARLSVQGVEPEFRLIELTLERAACVLLDDPARFLPHTRHLGSEHGMLQQPWSFLFTDLAAHIRRQVGVARQP